MRFERGKLIVVDNYLEAAGVMAALRSGVSMERVRRPIGETKVVCEGMLDGDVASPLKWSKA